MNNAYKIIRMHDHPGGLEEAIAYYHSKWGNERNKAFIEDAIKNSNYESLPQFFVLLKGENIVGCCGLIINDLISRHDLWPWFCGLFVEESERGQDLGADLLKFVEKTVKDLGFGNLYLSTDHISYYERYCWRFLGIGYEPDGSPTRIYSIKLN